MIVDSIMKDDNHEKSLKCVQHSELEHSVQKIKWLVPESIPRVTLVRMRIASFTLPGLSNKPGQYMITKQLIMNFQEKT